VHKESKTFALQRATNDSYHQLIVHYNLLQVVFYVYGEWHILKTRGTYLCHVLKAGGVFNASRGGKKLVPFLYRVKGRDIVFSAAFNNSSATNIWWRSASLVEETGIPGENHRPAAGHWQTWSYDVFIHIIFNIVKKNISEKSAQSKISYDAVTCISYSDFNYTFIDIWRG
jgi:hypothetical protein